ncbi:AfsR/SARP family transcriptional regulator [Kribbella sp. NPDC055071]
MATAASMTVRYRLLGPLTVFQDGVTLDLRSERHQRVLAALLLRANTPVSIADLLVAVWAYDPPNDGPQQLRRVVSEVRELIDPHRTPGTDGELTVQADGRYVLHVDRIDLDVNRFEDGVQLARQLRTMGRWDEAIRETRSALDLWRGVPLTGLAGPPFDLARDQLTAMHGQLLQELYQSETAVGQQQMGANPPVIRPGPAGYSPVTPSPPIRRVTTNWGQFWRKIGAAAVPVVTFGAGSPIMFGILAVRRRSVWLAASAAIYLAASVLFWSTDIDPDTSWTSFVVFSQLFAIAGASIQAAIVVANPQKPEQQPPPAIEQRPQDRLQ